MTDFERKSKGAAWLDQPFDAIFLFKKIVALDKD
jgi:hypothetical protein